MVMLLLVAGRLGLVAEGREERVKDDVLDAPAARLERERLAQRLAESHAPG
jgi:hypothetical protein